MRDSITTTVVDELLRTTPKPNPVEQVDLVLDYLDAHTSPGEAAPLSMERDYPIARALGPEALSFVVNSMVKDRLIEMVKKIEQRDGYHVGVPHFLIAMAGYERLKRRRDATAGDGGGTTQMKLPYIVLKNIGDGSKVGDIVWLVIA